MVGALVDVEIKQFTPSLLNLLTLAAVLLSLKAVED